MYIYIYIYIYILNIFTYVGRMHGFLSHGALGWDE